MYRSPGCGIDSEAQPSKSSMDKRSLYLGAALTAACAAASVHPILQEPDRSSDLSYSTFVSNGVVRASGARLPEGDPIVSSPITSTLIAGATDAVLVDPPLTLEQTRLVGDWIERSGKRLKYIYVTHAHGDHWFGSAQLVRRFPGMVVYATPGTIGRMHKQGVALLASREGRNSAERGSPR